MSAKKSWDIRRNPGRVVRLNPGPIIAERARVADRGPGLKVRRKKAKRRLLILFSVLLVVLLGVSVYVLWRPALRVQNISIAGFDASTLEPIVKDTLSGTYAWILPHDSIFFFSALRIRGAVMNAYPDIATVSVSRTGFDSIKIETTERVSAFDWCGSSADTAITTCYSTDEEGFIFAQSLAGIPDDGASTTPHTLRVYAPLDSAAVLDSSGTPIHSFVQNPSVIPAALRLERAIVSLGANVSSLQIRNDEADFFLVSGTRITYVLGHEEQAAQLAATAFPQINLNDGSVNYVDLRFDGKVYFKKKGG